MEVNSTFPLWSIIVTIVIFIVPIIWGIIKMHFKQEEMRKDIIRQDKEMALIKETVMVVKKDIEDKLDRHKTANDLKLMQINDVSVKTMTLVELLVKDQIKK